jgi:hypothetical protein
MTEPLAKSLKNPLKNPLTKPGPQGPLGKPCQCPAGALPVLQPGLRPPTSGLAFVGHISHLHGSCKSLQFGSLAAVMVLGSGKQHTLWTDCRYSSAWLTASGLPCSLYNAMCVFGNDS